MATRARPARFGPFHRRTYVNPGENEKVARSGEIWGRPRGNIYAAIRPAVKAWNGELPAGIVGYEFFTDIEPDPGSAPDWPQWTEGRPGVKIIEKNELVAIAVVVTKRQDPE